MDNNTVNKEAQTVAVSAGSGLVAGSIVGFVEKIKGILNSVTGVFRRTNAAENKFSPSLKLPRFKITKRNFAKILLPIVLIGAAALVVMMAFSPRPSVSGTNISIAPDVKPLATQNLNRKFEFPIRDGSGKEVGKLAYSIETAELRKQIIVQGKRATTVDGRVFLILNLKVANTLDQGMEINTRDYIRISVNGKEELFAPEIHNDPVEVQAISTKNTRLGLAINETDKDIKLQVGEINGKKEIIPVSF